ncbi:DUF3097 domain-containing protein [Streptomyces sp. NPDC006733]|uniref:DUF3097 domain-containing protein n=1 Tax=Streptomyces sp. NPDC006733 TaxID=3155460 RepID=UPI0033CC5846
MRSREYGPDLTPPWKKSVPAPEVAAEPDLVVEEVSTGFCGAVVRCEKTAEGLTVTLEDRFGKHRVFPMEPRGFLLDGRAVTLVRPRAGGPGAPRGQRRGPLLSASGSIAVQGARARVARAGRIYVEGRHDAELVERVWGHDLRVEGVVVEYLEGIDDLPAIVEAFSPGPDARLGVLVDHLVPGSKESRLASQVSGVADVLVVGHPYIDVWEAVKPSSVGIPAWPTVPRGQDWKTGVCDALGWRETTGEAWQRILASVRSYKDLEPALLGRVEELIDFVTAP